MGTAFTRIKMENVSFEEFRLALSGSGGREARL
ncbi:MAG TPA: hypothetical protein PLV51_01190 [Lentimicrobium sp.]|nr:hypothetical protein [Lentimicrobium sp.]